MTKKIGSKQIVAMALVALLAVGVLFIGVPSVANAAPDLATATMSGTALPATVTEGGMSDITVSVATPTDLGSKTDMTSITSITTSADLAVPGTAVAAGADDTKAVITVPAALPVGSYKIKVALASPETITFEVIAAPPVEPPVVVPPVTTPTDSGGGFIDATPTAAPKISYKVVETGVLGSSSKPVGGAKADATFVVNGPFAEFTGITVTGKGIAGNPNVMGDPFQTLKAEDFIVEKSGENVIVTLKKEALAKLADGEYVFNIQFKGGTVAVNVTVDKNAGTGTGEGSGTYRVIARRLNVRSGPGTNFPVVSRTTQNTTIEVVEIVDGWARLADGTCVSAAYLASNN